MMLNLYEVVRYGNDSDCVFTGGADGPDTCFLVRAGSPEQAAALVDPVLGRMSHKRVKSWAGQIFLLGSDGGGSDEARVLRGPFVERAYGHGWRTWLRDKQSGQWVELIRSGA